MAETELFVPSTYWEKKAPKQGTANTKIEFQRINPKTGEIEDSTVIYDKAGRKQYRIDKSDHGRPQDHTNPHPHEYEYGPGYRDGRPKP